MREIKFRAWDREKNVMSKVELMDFSDWWVSTACVYERSEFELCGERNSFKNQETDRHILMQYTCLKDKECKEIYEGDIVKTEDGIGVVEFLEFGWVISFEDKLAQPIINYLSYDSNDELYFIDDVFNVIGNIYENK